MASLITCKLNICSAACSGYKTRMHTMHGKRQSSALLTNCEANPPMTGGFPSQRPSTAENVDLCMPGCHMELRKMSNWLDPLASCQISKIAGAHAPGMPGTFSPSSQVSDPDMHHGTCVTHVPWCMSGSLTSGFLWNWRRGETFPTFPAHAQPAIFRIW